MQQAMVLRSRSVALASAIALAIALLALVVAPRPALAGGGACEKYGGASPGQLSKKQTRKAVLCLLNRERAQAGLPALSRSKKLERAAQKHSNQMRGTGCFSHQCAGEAPLDARLRGARYLLRGLTRWAYAENIAWGLGSLATPAEIVVGWMNSPPHRANILNGGLRDVGVGIAKGTPSSKSANGGVYTTDFGFKVG